MDRLRINRLDKVTIEFTTRCNLKCVYCAVTRPWHPKRDLDLAGFDELVVELKTLGVRMVQISGGGETTIVKGWDDYLYKLLDEGFQVTIITNLAKPMTERAARALSRCSEITTSCDTVDPEKFEAIRSGGGIHLFFHNILRIRALCAAEGRPAPRLIWNCVASDHVIFGLREWVAMGIAAGVDHFQVSELAQFPDVPGQLNVRPIGTLPLDALAHARAVANEARALAERAGKIFYMLPSVEEVLDGARKVRLTAPKLVRDSSGKEVLVSQQKLVQILDASGTATVEESQPVEHVPAGFTRNCLLPWREAIVWANNSVVPCCLYKDVAPFEADRFADSLNSDGFVAIRQGLLSGQLSYACEVCPIFELTPVEALCERVEALYGVATDAAR